MNYWKFRWMTMKQWCMIEAQVTMQTNWSRVQRYCTLQRNSGGSRIYCYGAWYNLNTQQEDISDIQWNTACRRMSPGSKLHVLEIGNSMSCHPGIVITPCWHCVGCLRWGEAWTNGTATSLPLESIFWFNSTPSAVSSVFNSLRHSMYPWLLKW